MKRLDQQAAVAHLHVDVAESAERHAAAGIETVQHAFVAAAVGELVLEGPEHVGRDRLELKANLVAGTTATLNAIVPLAF